ncbi:DUF1330 domain-containing protein [Olivibacter sp. SDN3]|uniref:DUF1330 domain-containing protein n=1 Tax=Olivibacter sp. SDN3 TaxID=2764720 RepID=UPI00165115F3|nr:DUF1330 domain-containing protein [Olivibacter sp. SDN3]QNL48798.1 DUF1330 domain-containing protein [Olivibacter sp. SDN3]
MLYITQLIYIKEGFEETFHQFEEIAIPAISKYNGQLLLRMRPNEASIIDAHIEKPYEIHIARFESDSDFEDFMQDEERKRFLHLKEKSIRSILLIKGRNI